MPARPAKRLDLIVIAIVAVAAVVLVVIDNYVLTDRSVARPARTPTIAVLPFADISPGTRQEYFADGISEAVLNALARVPQLRVAGRTSSFAFRGRSDNLRLIGDTLAVEHVLKGSVRKSGNRLRVEARLVGVGDGLQIWSQVFEGELAEVFSIQDEIVAAVLREFRAEVQSGEQDGLAGPVTDSRAYDYYLLARQRIHTRQRPMLTSAAELLDRVISLDPGYAPAYAQRGIAELLLAAGGDDANSLSAALQRSESWLDRSVELDKGLAEGWAGLGLYYLTRQDRHRQAIDALQLATAINPGLIDASEWFRIALLSAGDVAGARAIAERMAIRDPLYRPGFTGAVKIFNRFGEHDKAFALIDQVQPFLRDDPAVLVAEGITHLYMGNLATAYPLGEKAFELAPDNTEAGSLFGWTLIGTQQYARLAVDGTGAQKIAALDRLQRGDRAAELARRMAGDGDILPLLQHYNRNAQSDRLIGFVDERWPDLDVFEAAFPHDVVGHEEMAELVYAYSRSGDRRFRDALQRLGRVMDKLAAAGVDNWVFERNRAVYLALGSDTEQALASLSDAIDGGYRDILPLASARPVFGSLASDPRFELLEQRMRSLAEGDRALLGLPR